MILPSLRKLFRGDFPPEQQPLIDKLTPTVNTGMEVLYNAVGGRLTFKDNLQSTTKDITVTVDSSGIPTTSTSFTLNTNNKIDGLWVESAINLTDSTIYPVSAPWISFTQTSDKITINHISGLQANNSYKLRVLANGA